MKYGTPEMEVILIDFKDVIVTSLNQDVGGIPVIPGDGEEEW